MLIHDYSLSINNQSAVSPKVEQTPILTNESERNLFSMTKSKAPEFKDEDTCPPMGALVDRSKVKISEIPI
jgi:hypothetical protein